jgi:hypothetical protein
MEMVGFAPGRSEPKDLDRCARVVGCEGPVEPRVSHLESLLGFELLWDSTEAFEVTGRRGLLLVLVLALAEE